MYPASQDKSGLLFLHSPLKFLFHLRDSHGSFNFIHLACQTPQDQGIPAHKSMETQPSLETEPLFMENISTVCGLPEFGSELLATLASHLKQFHTSKLMLVGKIMQERK
jgi:hypothetical protein